MNGSEEFGGCPLICRREAGGIDVCDCRPNDLANFLVDGVIPDIGNPSGSNTWASQLFTIERTILLQNRAIIGFDLGVQVIPTTVVITMFNCPPWDIYADTITVYSSGAFPSFVLTELFATPVGSISPDCTSCDSLLTFHVPVDVSPPVQSVYYVEFAVTGPDTLSREWVHLAEVSFTNDPPPPTPDPNTPAPNCTIIPTPTIASSPTPTSSSSMMTTGRSGSIMIRYASMSVCVCVLSLYLCSTVIIRKLCLCVASSLFHTLSFVYPESSSTSQTTSSGNPLSQ